jgi:hypothetical protein
MWYLVHSAVLLQDGFPCLPLHNPSDHLLGSVNSDFDKVKVTLTALVIFLFMEKSFLTFVLFFTNYLLCSAPEKIRAMGQILSKARVRFL